MKKTSIVLTACLLVMSACHEPAAEPDKNLAPTMGWSSWNTYGINISEQLIREQADAMASSGLKEAGYEYINIDDGYFGRRDSTDGHLLIHPEKFPNGLRPLVDYIHGLGLKAGIYTDAGDNTCASGQGAEWGDKWGVGSGIWGHDQQDMDYWFVDCGFDFIKIDYCGGSRLQGLGRITDERQRYTEISQAMDRAAEKAGRTDLRMNICRWAFPGTWAKDVSGSWRTTGDIWCNWSSVRGIIAENLYLSAYASPGHYNDMDMLEVGRGLSVEEDKTHFGIWCIMSSPLLIGCDMTTLRSEAFDLLTNRDLIALDQDPLGLQAYVVQHIGETYVFVKDIEERFSGVRAVAFYNPADEPCHMGIDLKDLDLAGGAQVRDLFERKDIGTVTDRLEADVPAHGTRIYRLAAKQRLERVRYEAETAWLSDYQELYNNQAFQTATYTPVEGCSGGVAVTKLGFKPTNDIQWRDIWSPKGGEYKLTLRCLTNEPRGNMIYLSDNPDNARQVRIAPDTEWQDVEVTVNLKPGLNTIRIANDRSGIPDIDYMELQPLR